MKAHGTVAVVAADAHVAPGGLDHLQHLAAMILFQSPPELLVELDDDALHASIARARQLRVDVVDVGLDQITVIVAEAVDSISHVILLT